MYLCVRKRRCPHDRKKKAMSIDIEKYVELYGEQHRKLINDSLCWLDEKEKCWGVHVDREGFVRDLIIKAGKVRKND
jgi:hypothetical protein